MLFVLSDDEGKEKCCLLCQMMKASMGGFLVSDHKGQGDRCLLCEIMKARVSVVSCVR